SDAAAPKALPESTADGEAIEEVPPSEAARGEEAKKKQSLAVRVRHVVMDLGPSFVKLGQIASTRPDLFPADWVVELKKLQDEVRPLPFADIRTAVESSLGR